MKSATDRVDSDGEHLSQPLVYAKTSEINVETVVDDGIEPESARITEEQGCDLRCTFSATPLCVIQSEPRGTWTGRFDFLISMIAYAVGLGNVWRFPYLCFKNGGGAFLVAYAVFWALAAVPIFLLEVTLGQYLQRGGIEVWSICPIFKGVGLANLVITFLCICYYCIIAAWAIFYILASLVSLNSPFPWETCTNWWNLNDTCVEIGSVFVNQSIINDSDNFTSLVIATKREATRQSVQNFTTSVEQFWDFRVLQKTSSIDHTGGVQWELLFINLFLWCLLYFVLWRGITKARHIVYVCALTPYLMLIALLIRGLTLPGAIEGIKVYLIPNVTKLLDPRLWQDAGTQVFYSYGVGYGALMALGSHNEYHHNCYKDAMTMCVLNCSTSLLAGFVVFSILGYMAHMTGKAITEVVKSGIGLAFLAYPEVAAILPFKQLWAVLLFVILTILGMDTQICLVEGAATAVEDMFPFLLRKHKKLFVFVVCAMGFICGIPFVFKSGSYWLTLVDAYGCSGIALLFIVFFEVFGIAWGFGAEKVYAAMEDMFGFRPPRFWYFLWKFTAPLCCLSLFVVLLIDYEPLKYPNNDPYPAWALAIGYCLGLCSMACIPGYAVFYMCRTPGTFAQRFWHGFKSQSGAVKYPVAYDGTKVTMPAVEDGLVQ